MAAVGYTLSSEIWPNGGVTGQLSQDLPTFTHFEQAAAMVTEDDATASTPCGDDVGAVVDSVQQYLDAGYDHVYLHQVKILQPDGTLEAWSDLTPKRLTTWTARSPRRRCRVHFHVPLDFTGNEGLATTGALLTPDFYAAARHQGTRHFEIETYTFAVLPPALRERTLVESIIAEYRQVLSAWGAA